MSKSKGWSVKAAIDRAEKKTGEKAAAAVKPGVEVYAHRKSGNSRGSQTDIMTVTIGETSVDYKLAEAAEFLHRVRLAYDWLADTTESKHFPVDMTGFVKS
jgi:hypothetical protein